MAYYDHLPLRQINHIGDRRKSAGGKLPPRNPEKHAVKLKSEVDAVVEEVSHAAPTDGIDPTLIVKIHVSRQLTDDDWKAVDLQTLSQVTNEAVILFSADSELNEFRRRLEEYSGPKPQGNKGHKYAQLFEVIDGISPLSPEDRIGPALTAEGISSTDHFDPEVSYLLDLELWCPSGDLVDVFINRVITPFENGGGELLDRYTPPSGILLRVRGNGQAIRELLTRDEVAIVDLPPQPDLEYSDAPDPDVDQVGSILSPDPMAMTIGIVDSGVNDEHPLLRDVVVGSFGVGGQPGSDSHGHGTSVAAIAAYGDLDAMLRNREFKPKFQIASARVLDDRGRFPDIEIAHRLVEEAICRLHEEYGCRVINMSLGNRLRLVDERGTLWSESLDRLARELDLIIVVSAGNVARTQLQKTHGDNIPYAYPDYLRDACNRIVDPAGAANVLTVGSVAHVNGLAEGNPISIQSLASKDEPSPFTRTGPGIGGGRLSLIWWIVVVMLSLMDLHVV